MARLRQEVPGKCKGFFSVDGPVKPLLEDGRLTLVAENDFVKKVVDIPQVLEAAARLSTELLGRPVTARCVKRDRTVSGGRDPMRTLLDFGQEHSDIITIKE